MYDGYDVQSVSRPIVQFGHLASRSMTIDNIGFANIRDLITHGFCQIGSDNPEHLYSTGNIQ